MNYILVKSEKYYNTFSGLKGSIQKFHFKNYLSILEDNRVCACTMVLTLIKSFLNDIN